MSEPTSESTPKSTSESAFDLQRSIEGLLDAASSVDFSAVREAVHKKRAENPKALPEEIARMMIQDQANWSGLVGAGTGLFGLPLLVVTLPVSLLKTLKLQAFTIQSVAYAYGYSAETTDFKTDASLILSNKSFDEISRRLQEMFVAQIEQACTDPEASLDHEERDHQSRQNLKVAVTQTAAKVATSTAVKSTLSNNSKYIAQGAVHAGKTVYEVTWYVSTQLMPQLVQRASAFPLIRDALLKAGTRGMSKLTQSAVTSPLSQKVVVGLSKVIQSLGSIDFVKESAWRLFGKQVAEKGASRVLSRAVPVVGAVISGGMDWWAIQQVGNVAIDYYKNNGPEHLQALTEIFGMTTSDDWYSDIDFDQDNPFMSIDLDDLFS